MNEVIETLNNHRSIRDYKDDQVRADYIDEIVKAAQSAPSWINGQHVSIISVIDKEKKKRLSELVGNQLHVDQASVFFVFCLDFYRAYLSSKKEGYDFVIPNEIDSLFIGTTDVGLSMGNAIAAAESLGLGIIPIGGIRRNPLEVIELLRLPKYVLPISGLCIGYAEEVPELKPRLPKEAVFHHEEYNPELQEWLETYNQTISQYNAKRTNGKNTSTWTERVAKYYSTQKYKDIYKMLEKQGFNFDHNR